MVWEPCTNQQERRHTRVERDLGMVVLVRVDEVGPNVERVAQDVLVHVVRWQENMFNDSCSTRVKSVFFTDKRL